MHKFCVVFPFFYDSLFGLWQFPLTMLNLSNRSKTKICLNGTSKRGFQVLFFIARELTKRKRVHLLTVSQRECKEITKTTLEQALSWDFHFTVPVIAALWLMLFVSFILSKSREDQHCTAPVLGGLISPKIHTCVSFLFLFFFLSDCSGHLAVFKIIASF